MNIEYGLPYGFKIGKYSIRIQTSSLFWIELLSDMESREQRAINLLERAILHISDGKKEIEFSDIESEIQKKIFNKLMWFVGGGKEITGETKKQSGEKLISYKQDIDAIYSAFLQAYGLDLYKFIRVENGRNIYLIDDIHFWKFLALVSNMPKGNNLTDYYIYYRSVDLSKLPTKTDEDRKYKSQIAEIKRNVSLNVKKTSKKYTYFDRLVEERKKLRG
mgnify:CR=1 FL=1